MTTFAPAAFLDGRGSHIDLCRQTAAAIGLELAPIGIGTLEGRSDGFDESLRSSPNSEN